MKKAFVHDLGLVLFLSFCRLQAFFLKQTTSTNDCAAVFSTPSDHLGTTPATSLSGSQSVQPSAYKLFPVLPVQTLDGFSAIIISAFLAGFFIPDIATEPADHISRIRQALYFITFFNSTT